MKTVLFLFVGLFCLWSGATLVVESAKNLAAKFKISQTLIGLTIISIGTSLPEIFTNVASGIKTASGSEASGIAIGTNIGSCLTQITLILGVTAIIGTIYARKKTVVRDGSMVLVAIVAMFLAGLNGIVSRIEGIILVTVYLIYLYVISNDENVLKSINTEIKSDEFGKTKLPMLYDFLLITGGIALLIFGSDLVVENAITLAEMFGLSQSFIGVMIIGVGTGLPELSTAIMGIIKKAGDISLGTLIGSNVTDPMFSLGSGAIAAGAGGLLFEKNLLFFDLPFWFISSIIALYLINRSLKMERKQGFIMVSLYAVFVVLKIMFFST